jgi:diguanylate cyclase (GGDEF)-like protein
VAQIAQGALRAVDALGRFGGEEFLVLLPGTPLAGALESAHRMQQLFAEHPLQHGGQQIAVTASFGVATLQADEVPEGFIKRSDAAMYRAKQGGRNRVESA